MTRLSNGARLKDSGPQLREAMLSGQKSMDFGLGQSQPVSNSAINSQHEVQWIIFSFMVPETRTNQKTHLTVGCDVD